MADFGVKQYNLTISFSEIRYEQQSFCLLYCDTMFLLFVFLSSTAGLFFHCMHSNNNLNCILCTGGSTQYCVSAAALNPNLLSPVHLP